MAQTIVGSCPIDGCPLRRFTEVKASHGYTIALHGCIFCNFDFVIAAATDANDNTRLVAQWTLNANGRYVLRQVWEHNPHGWVALACSALPKNRQPGQQEQQEEAELFQGNQYEPTD